jgi:hypothetical protein
MKVTCQLPRVSSNAFRKQSSGVRSLLLTDIHLCKTGQQLGFATTKRLAVPASRKLSLIGSNDFTDSEQNALNLAVVRELLWVPSILQ